MVLSAVASEDRCGPWPVGGGFGGSSSGKIIKKTGQSVGSILLARALVVWWELRRVTGQSTRRGPFDRYCSSLGMFAEQAL